MFNYNKWNNLKLLYAAIPILPIHALGITIKLEVNMKLQGPYLEQRHLQIRGFAPYNFSYSGNEPCRRRCRSRYVRCKNIVLICDSISNCPFKILIQSWSLFGDVSFAVFCSTRPHTVCICEDPEFI